MFMTCFDTMELALRGDIQVSDHSFRFSPVSFLFIAPVNSRTDPWFLISPS